MRGKTELLSPAGNWDCARAAVANGADAIFFGLPSFNARMRADNFTEEDLPALMEYLHKHGVRGFVTMNTLIFTNELTQAAQQLAHLQNSGVDAVIIQDLGLAQMAKEIAPDVAIHASTQMTITSPEGLSFIESLLPLQRAVLSRELSIKEIARFTENTTPLEVFVHGALCVAYSGQCLTSESLGQRSANRGECAQACRMPYELVVDGITRPLNEVRYLLSPQDLAAVELIPSLVQAGVKSFKIEGRLKSPEYVAAVTKVYRKALDDALALRTFHLLDQDRYALEMTFSRGLTTGWLAGTNHPYLTHGRFGKKRGALLGEIIRTGSGWIELSQSHPIPLLPGDGVVFDAGEDRNKEQGGPIWKIEAEKIYFHKTFCPLDWSRIRPGMSVWKTSDPRLQTTLKKSWAQARPALLKKPLHIHITGSSGKPLTLTCEDHTLQSNILLEPADKRPLTQEVIHAQLSRLGDTNYELASLTLHLTNPCHLPISELNRMRRELTALLDQSQKKIRCTPGTFSLPEKIHTSPTPPELSVLVRSIPQLEAVLQTTAANIYCDFEDPRRYKDAVALASNKNLILATPRIIKAGEDGYLKLIERSGAAGILIRNLAALKFYQNKDLIRIGDFSLNIANPITAQLLKQNANLHRLTISYDLNIRQVLDLLNHAPAQDFELTLHQHMPMFHMEHCVFCTFMSPGTDYKNCGRPCENHNVQLRDRVGLLHKLSADVGCRNTLFNARAQTGARFLSELKSTGLKNFRVELLDESPEAAEQTITLYQKLLQGEINSDILIEKLGATEKLGVTEGTLRH